MLAHVGVCYYPEHWPREEWAEHARLMAGAGINRVRIAEFAWSRIEPAPGEFRWDWLDEAVTTLADAGLGIILCTPTACPPHWLVQRHPEILPVDRDGRLRGFGSRRHYRFASERYREEARRISRAVIERYAAHPAVVGWQLDNEYGCHDTTRSYADDDRRAFQDWLRGQYRDVGTLNEAWGTVFWSQEYADFDDVGLPNLTVTEANPAHELAWCRFASDAVVDFNRDQVDILRQCDGGSRWVTHNFMGNFTDFDHFAVARDLDVATWDSYPLGFLDQGDFSDDEKLRYRRIGHPDWAAFHHDLYRAVGRGRFGVMEQQPGPVNWAPSNAAPLDDTPAFWGMEAVAHGAELVSFFRFRQMPRAQEQMHAALRLPDGSPAPAWKSVQRFTAALADLAASDTRPADVALLFDYSACWATDTQPHAPGMDAFGQAFHVYSAARSLGLDIDIVGPDTDLAGYRLLLIPGTVIVTDALVDRIVASGARCLIGPRSGSRDAQLTLPAQLPPGPLQRLIPLRVVAVDSMRRGAARSVHLHGQAHTVTRWYEAVETDLTPRLRCADGAGLWYEHDGHHYLNGHVDRQALALVLEEIAGQLGIATQELPEGLRLRRRGDLLFAFNFSPEPRRFTPGGATLRVGTETLAQGDWSIWSQDDAG